MLRTHDHLDERQFVIAVQRMADSLGYGADTSPYVGAGIDYAQSRMYTFGDSIKSIDWRVTARTGKAFVKEYEAHKRMPIYLLLDTSGSMMVGSTARSKYEWAVMLAGALALAGLNRLNPVALFACSEADITSDHHLRFHPSLSRQQVYQWLHHLRVLPQMKMRATALATALRDVDISTNERSVIVILSDMHEPEAAGAIKRMAQRHDVIVLRLQDPAERGRTGGGIFRASEAETGERFVATGRSRYLEEETVTADLRRAGVSMITLPTEREFLPELRFFLKTRASGRGGR